MQPEIIFIVDGFDKNGIFQTVEDKFLSICGNKSYNLYLESKQALMNSIGNKIKLQAYKTITYFDPNKKYYYICPLNNFENDLNKYFRIFDSDQLKKFNDNNVSIIFSQDLEMCPNFQWDYMVKSLEWLYTSRGFNGCPNIKIILSFLSKIIPEQDNFIKNYFNNSIRFIYSPVAFDYYKNKIGYNTDYDIVMNTMSATQKHK